MAKRAKPNGSPKITPGVVERQRMQLIAESKRALRQERQLAALARQLRGALVRRDQAREELLTALAAECGWLVTKHGPGVPATE